MRNTLIVAVLAVAATPAFAAEGISYTYAEFGYLNADGADGFGLKGSFAIDERFHVLGNVARVSDGPVDVNTYGIAGGYRFGLSEQTDFVARVGLNRTRVGTPFGSASDNGWMVQGGVRTMIDPTLELNGFATVMDIGSTEFGIGAGAVKMFSEQFGATADLELVDGDFTFGLGVRFNF